MITCCFKPVDNSCYSKSLSFIIVISISDYLTLNSVMFGINMKIGR